jgi:hypothetical protein
MILYDCNTIVAVALLTSRLPNKDALLALNTNLPCIGDDVTEFDRNHINQIWEHMRLHQPKWYSFALGLNDDEDPRLDRGVERFRNGCLHGSMYGHAGEEVTFDTVMMKFEKIVGPVENQAEDMGVEFDDDDYELDELGTYRTGEKIADDEQMAALWEKDKLDVEGFHVDLDEYGIGEI